MDFCYEIEGYFFSEEEEEEEEAPSNAGTRAAELIAAVAAKGCWVDQRASLGRSTNAAWHGFQRGIVVLMYVANWRRGGEGAVRQNGAGAFIQHGCPCARRALPSCIPGTTMSLWLYDVPAVAPRVSARQRGKRDLSLLAWEAPVRLPP